MKTICCFVTFVIYLHYTEQLGDRAECGVQDIKPNIYSKIFGGVEATPHSWPWQISIKYSKNNWQHWCGGSVIHPHWVITAAHCVNRYRPVSDFKIVLGEHNRLVDEGTEQEFEVSKIIIQDKYDNGTYDNDIALIRLKTDVQFNRYIQPICLPNVEVEDDKECYVTGWGDTKGTGHDTLLNEISVPVINRFQCNKKEWHNGRVTVNMICAGDPNGGKDSCKGDSGGPLACLSDDRWTLFGLTSWGERPCAKHHKPGVYTRVTRYLDWIQEKTGQEIKVYYPPKDEL